LSARHHDASRELVAELGWKDQASFVVEFGFVGSEQHGRLLSGFLALPPLYSIFLHFAPFLNKFENFFAGHTPAETTKKDPAEAGSWENGGLEVALHAAIPSISDA
jgi:hypothetical protein